MALYAHNQESDQTEIKRDSLVALENLNARHAPHGAPKGCYIRTYLQLVHEISVLGIGVVRIAVPPLIVICVVCEEVCKIYYI